MSIRSLIILSQLNPPAARGKVLERERINQRLQQSLNYPLTIVHAGTGFGKSTAILSFLKHQEIPVFWFTTSGTDRDPKLFLAKLFTAFNQHGISFGEEALRILDMPEATHQEALTALLNEISRKLNQSAIFIVDDFHRVSDVPEVIQYLDWMVEHLPPELHVVISSRTQPNFPSLNKWLLKGKVLEIDKDDLVFTEEEIKRLFNNLYGIVLSVDTAHLLHKKTEGWAIGLQVVWQALQNYPDTKIQQVLDEGQHSRTTLFKYLAEEVFSGLPVNLQDFLIRTSILSKLDSSTCDFLVNISNSDEVLVQIQNMGLFVDELRPGVWRYHELFREFLSQRLQNSGLETKELHLKVASYFRAHEYWEETIYHLLLAEEYQQINLILENIGDRMIRDGRYESIKYWISEIPETERRNFPYMAYLLGEVYRYLENFNQALEYYHTAERFYRQTGNKLGLSMSLKGQGQVFLDTIRPINADQLLQEALSLLSREENREQVADLLVLIAENQLNLGHPDRAEKFLAQARGLRSELDKVTDLIQARIFLRTGRLKEGIALLIDREADSLKIKSLSRPQRFHRESTLLLSLFYAIIGEIDKAEHYALQGIEIGEVLESQFVKSVGYMRLGHTHLLRSQEPFLKNSFDQAMQLFQKSIDYVDVTRIHVEPLWGMCRGLGYTGEMAQAEKLASESLAIAKKAGDEWIGILIQLSIGAGAVLAKRYDDAQFYLTTAETSALKVKDPFTLCVSRLWLALKAWNQGFPNTAFGYLEKSLTINREHDYRFLLTRPTLVGLKDPETIFPLLLAAYQNRIMPEYLQQIFQERAFDPNTYHPGYSLWIQSFGDFRVWRGEHELNEQDWKREKSRQLLQLFVVNRDKWLHKDQINSILWADNPVENASNYFKVVLNALNQVLEPGRPRGAQPFFIERRQESYRLNSKARFIIDTDIFEQGLEIGSKASLQRSVDLYHGKFMADCFMQEWCVIEEQYYHQNYLLGAEKLISLYINHGQLEKALDLSYQVLNQDSLWEPVYRSQMSIFHEMGQYAMVRKVYDQCKEIFRKQLESMVSPATTALYEKLKSPANLNN
jgi:ATP/maltotriose-dependent transcriptional regulator MalT/DNA-binding SARP family transcriptional activator